MTYTLGINCSGFHSSACLLGDGAVLAAICEERLSRIKRDKSFPHRAIDYCCRAAGIDFDEIRDAFVGWNPRHYLRRSDGALGDALRSRGKMSYLALNELATHLNSELLDVEEALRSRNGELAIHFVDHHMAHLANAFHTSGYASADYLILDGFGELTTGMCGRVGPNGIETFHQYPTPHSIGSFYSAFTDFMGFAPETDEWKVMALSAMGNPDVFYDRVRPLMRADGLRLELDLSCFEHFLFFKPGYFSSKLEELLGPARRGEAALGQREFDIVAAAQRVAEETIFSLLDALRRRTGGGTLVVGGGFFMNSVCNGKLENRTGYRQVFIGGSPDDSGVSLGSALYGAHEKLKMPRRAEPLTHNFFGRTYTNAQIEEELKRRLIRYVTVEDAPRVAARLLREGRILGWFQGGSEFGQRALGNRSILTSPLDAAMKDRVNASVKYREWFRPFAPAVLAERQAEIFETEPGQTGYFMEKVLPIRPPWRERIPAVTHCDGSGRMQTVLRETNPRFHALIEHFDALTGVPVVLNTSFNINGMPLVETPGDALSCFYECGMEALILGDCLVEK